MAPYIPRKDLDFDGWQQQFVAYVSAHLSELGLTAGDIAELLTAQSDWVLRYPAHRAAQTQARATRAAKDLARRALETAARALARQLQASPAVDDGERKALGLTVSDRVRTRVRPPTTRPLVKVDASDRGRHIIHFYDLGKTTRKARPHGVIGAEIWVAIGPVAPTDPRGYTLLGMDSRSPYTAEFSPQDAGKTAHYMLRWVNTRGERGPWSETVSATILA